LGDLQLIFAALLPDFLAGTSLNSMHCGAGGVATGNGIWSLLEYDGPGVPVANGDLSRYSTGRGIRIGSSYCDVLPAYDSEEIPFVIQDDRVRAITVSVDLPGQF
jgi:hypothetical protein